ncbi:hypothetical protein Pmar_PMAR025517 [Perkinsus marinus ATCC 50983]|uniref:Uncharacterized protein n=1 Tax=Perkinsus marinus (strain ATCC 50983 / TXsc) TaxID=423536 RepID=C5LZA0_PERM5|nr:hypothetical protein Pmar_PMAR025517 [Perkinsus marinus ATCC 50983]EEQ97894.1 hypothetical protein Pmar_PMAR025517 [Perkinsus marinus ATCC 50983]|eukprot:XP_002765177.1 hypothetical protein Pmar_PMAR025517 [Perkinsus marinus ATCC 50983]
MSAAESLEGSQAAPPPLEKLENTAEVAQVENGAVGGSKELLRKNSGLPPIEIDAPISGELYRRVFYRRSNQSYGNRRPPERTLYGEKVENPSAKYGLSNKFTDHLAAAKMYRNRSLKTAVDRERFMEGTRDWMMKL